ncbi:hypothetical protein [Solibacillus sp. CAU 1738]|uniref:uridine kinase family protein n=1 Tax=Solibacillus sp. CAU 1738 TaxID=3140363 RepID=UPI0032607D92
MKKISDIKLVIQQSLQQNEPTIIAIDGPATSGKSTMAENLKNEFDIVVIPMDHFFLPMTMKTKERLSEIGGNVDYKRVEEEVCIPFKNGELSLYQSFNCQTKNYEENKVQQSSVLVLEGVYALHPTLQKYVDYALLLEISPSEQMNRLERRNTPQMVEKFIKEWIPLENKYFEYLEQMEGWEI